MPAEGFLNELLLSFLVRHRGDYHSHSESARVLCRSPEDLPAFSEAIVSQLAGTTTKEEEKS